MVIVRDDPTAYYFTQVSICFVVSAATTLLIFVPKIVFMSRGGFEQNPDRKSVLSTTRRTTKRNSDASGGFRQNYSDESGGFCLVLNDAKKEQEAIDRSEKLNPSSTPWSRVENLGDVKAADTADKVSVLDPQEHNAP